MTKKKFQVQDVDLVFTSLQSNIKVKTCIHMVQYTELGYSNKIHISAYYSNHNNDTVYIYLTSAIIY